MRLETNGTTALDVSNFERLTQWWSHWRDCGLERGQWPERVHLVGHHDLHGDVDLVFELSGVIDRGGGPVGRRYVSNDFGVPDLHIYGKYND